MEATMPPVHPGEILLEEFLKPMEISQTQLARETSMPQSRIRDIVARKREISADTAIRLAAYFGNSPEFWMNCQSSYELDCATYTGKRSEIFSRIRPYGCENQQNVV